MRLKVGIIGFGVGEQHIRGFENSGVDVVAICDKDPEKRKEAQKKHSHCKIFKNSKSITNSDEIDIVSIASYDQDHFNQVIDSINSNKHVFCEKPLCMNEKELKEIRLATKKNPSIKLSTNTILRMSERFREIHKKIRLKKFGQIFSVEGDYNYGRLHKITQGWRSNVKNYSVILGGGIHLVDLLLWYVNSPIIEVYALGNNICSKNSRFKYNDMVTSLVRFENGVIGKISANFGCVYPHSHKIVVYGTKATFVNDVSNGFFYESRDPQKSPTNLESKYPGLQKSDLIPSFVDSIKGVSDAIVDKETVFRVMSTCIAIDKSLTTKKPQKVKFY